jgi:hypothetical protein
MLNLKKVNKVECKDQYHIEVSNAFPASEDLDTKVEINSGLETIRGNIKMLPKESKHFYELK